MEEEKREHSGAREEPRRESGSAETSMEAMSGKQQQQQQRDQAEPVGRAEDTARLRLMEISQAVPPADEVESNDDDEEGHSHHEPPQNPERSPSRPDTEEEIRRKLMSISYSFEQPVANSGQPVVG